MRIGEVDMDLNELGDKDLRIIQEAINIVMNGLRVHNTVPIDTLEPEDSVKAYLEGHKN